jgi:hypothetical protein
MKKKAGASGFFWIYAFMKNRPGVSQAGRDLLIKLLLAGSLLIGRRIFLDGDMQRNFYHRA